MEARESRAIGKTGRQLIVVEQLVISLIIAITTSFDDQINDL